MFKYVMLQNQQNKSKILGDEKNILHKNCSVSVKNLFPDLSLFNTHKSSITIKLFT